MKKTIGFFLLGFVAVALLIGMVSQPKGLWPVPVVAALSRNFSAERDTLVAQEALRAGVSVRLALAVSHVENWSGDSAAVSKAGAVGLMQIMPKYWQHSFEDECGCGSITNRRRNACVGVRVLGHYLDKHKSVEKALRAYHGSLTLHSAGDVYIAAVLDKMIRVGGLAKKDVLDDELSS